MLVVTSWLYRGTLVHTRRDHLAQRTFRYPVYMAAIDLAHPPTLRLLSRNARNLFSLHDRDYTTPLTRGTLITNLRVAGYVFNPVSFFLHYTDTQLSSVIAEVNNTYGGRHCYTLDAENQLAPGRFRTARTFFVSPFLHGERTYEWTFPVHADPEHLAITMHVDAPERRVFTAALTARREPLTDLALARAALRYPLMTAQVIGLIHLEAMKLRYLHGVPYRRPGPDHRPLDS